MRVVVRGAETGSLSVAQAGLELMEVLLPQPPKFWDVRFAVPAFFFSDLTWQPHVVYFLNIC